MIRALFASRRGYIFVPDEFCRHCVRVNFESWQQLLAKLYLYPGPIDVFHLVYDRFQCSRVMKLVNRGFRHCLCSLLQQNRWPTSILCFLRHWHYK
jgi:hypothetical protein